LFLTTKNICCIAGSFVCFILVLEHSKHELLKNFEIMSLFWTHDTIAFTMFGEDMSSCCGDADGSSIIQFQLFAA
jgi:hypothetical protein